MTAPVQDLTRSDRRSARFPGLDGLRGVGALMVLTTHVGFHSGAALNTEFRGILSRMDAGVAIFFVISGFLLSRPFFDAWMSGRSGPSVLRYARNRVWRILPALWLAVVLTGLLVQDAARTWQDLALHAALLQIYVTGHETLGLTQMWSLATEVAFYAVLPLLMLAARRLLRPDPRGIAIVSAVLAATPAVGAAWVAWAVTTEPHRAVWLPGHIGWFGLGMLLTVWHLCRRDSRIGPGLLDLLTEHPWTSWALAGGLYLTLASPVAGPYSLITAEPWQAAVKSLGYAVFAVLVVLPATRADDGAGPGATRALGRSGWRLLGDISYGVFCYHLIVLHLVERATGHEVFSGGFWVLWLATAAGSVVAAWLSYRYMERPLLSWVRRHDR